LLKVALKHKKSINQSYTKFLDLTHWATRAPNLVYVLQSTWLRSLTSGVTICIIFNFKLTKRRSTFILKLYMVFFFMPFWISKWVFIETLLRMVTPDSWYNFLVFKT
jgi:hypothetical protein